MTSFSFLPGKLSVNSMRPVGAAICLLCLTRPAIPQEAAPTLQDRAQQVPTLSVTTQEVLLDVVVTDSGGHPVTGLKASDFKVVEEGTPQVVASLQVHGQVSAEEMARLAAAPALPLNTFTNFTPVANTNAYTVILLDALNTRLDAQMYVRVQLIDYLKHMQPGTPVAIFQRDTQMRMIQGFSSDPKVLLAATESKRNMPALLKLVKGNKDEYLQYRIDTVAGGFQMMGRYLAGFPGRKNLIWLTGALPNSSERDPMSDPFNDEFSIREGDPRDLTAALTLSRVAVYPIDARGLDPGPQFDAGARRLPGANANSDFLTAEGFQHTSLQTVAESTGGKAYYSSNGLKGVLAEIVNNGSNYYTLSYATTNKSWEGEFRHIRISVDRPRVKLQYRQGYYAVNHDKLEKQQLAALQGKHANAGNNPVVEPGAANGSTAGLAGPTAGALKSAKDTAAHGAPPATPEDEFGYAMQLGAVPPTEVVITARISQGDKVEDVKRDSPWPADNNLSADYRDKPFRTDAVLIDADAKTLHLTRTADGMRHGNVEFAVAVYDEMGKTVNMQHTTAELNVDEETYRRMLKIGLPAQLEIAVPVKGNYFLRIGVHDVASDHIGTLEIAADEVHADVPGNSPQAQ
jgi:VWFA-related protein